MASTKTELVLILDKSGSMSGLEADTIGGYNGMLAKQKAMEGAARITTVLFDSGYELLHDRVAIAAVPEMTDKDYSVGGATALLEAIGRTINKFDYAHKNDSEEWQTSKVLFVITTDGMENASREYSYAQIRQMIERQRVGACWEFIFLGANMDTMKVAASFGIASSRAQNYHADSAGTQLNFEVMAEAITQFRRSGTLADNWGEGIQADYDRRGGGKRVR